MTGLLIATAILSAGSSVEAKKEVIQPYQPWLAKVRQCETGNRNISDASGTYHGYYQFDLTSWRGAGGTGSPKDHGRLEQDYRAVKWRLKSGKNAWPVCG